MSHEMTRTDAEAQGIPTGDLTVSIPGATRDQDVVDIWEMLPPAEEFNP